MLSDKYTSKNVGTKNERHSEIFKLIKKTCLIKHFLTKKFYFGMWSESWLKQEIIYTEKKY